MTLAGIVMAVLVALIADEFVCWAPLLCKWLIRRSSRVLPPSLSERCYEEWLSHLDEIPGRLSKLLFALDTFRASRRVGHDWALPDVRYWEAASIRLIDLCFGIGALVFILPAILSIIIALLFESGGKGPILQRRAKVGRFGLEFELFRFSVTTPEAIQPRTGTDLSRVGRILSRFSFDELPQLINLIKGDVSLVGPQPYSPDLVDRLRSDIASDIDRRHLVRPGIAGLPLFPREVLRRRSSCPVFKQGIQLVMDLYFVENFSLKLVLQNLKTLCVVLFGIRKDKS